MKKTLWVLLLAVGFVFACLAFSAQADGAAQFSVAASGGAYTTIENALADVERKANNGELTAAGVHLVLEGTHTATVKDGILFGQKTIFLPGGSKLPITISGGTLNLPAGDVVCTNDYTFTDLKIPLDDIATKLYAGTGNVVLGKITTDLNGTAGENLSRFYGDNCTEKAFEGWTEDDLELYSEDGLFVSSMTLANGFEFATQASNIFAAVGSSVDFSAKVGAKTVSADDTCPKMIVDGAVVGNTMARIGKNPVANSVLHVKSGTIRHLYAANSTQKNLTGDITVIVDGGTLWDFPRILNGVTLNGDLNVTIKNIDQTKNTVENGAMLQMAFGGVTLNGDLTVLLENVKADRYYGAHAGNSDSLKGNLNFTAKNCEFSKFIYSGFGSGTIVGNVENTLENVTLPYYRGLDECASLTGNVTTSFKNVNLLQHASGQHVYMGSSKSVTINGNLFNTMENVTVGKNTYLYMGSSSGTLKGNITSTVKSGTYTDYFYGANNSGTVTGTITNRIEGGSFSYETYLAGFTNTIQGQVINYVSGGTFTHYLFGGVRSGKITNTTVDYAIKNYYSGGEFSGVWGGSGGASATQRSNIYSEITGGTFGTYSADSSKMNSFAGGPRNSKHEGNAKTLIRGGIFEGWVAGGTIPNSESQSVTSVGNTELTLAGGDFRHPITANCRWGTYNGTTILNINTKQAVEPLKIAVDLECDDFISASDTYELISPTTLSAKNIITRGSKPLILDGKVSAETLTLEKGAASPFVYGTLQLGNLITNDECIRIGAVTRITAERVVGKVNLHQTELWAENTYFTSPAGTVINLSEAEEAFGRVQLKDGIVKGLSSSLAGVSFIFADNVSLRFAFDKEWIDTVKNDFSFTAKTGEQTIVNAAKFSDLILMDGYYTIVSSDIKTANYNQDIVYSGNYIPEHRFKMTELAATGIKIYDKASQQPELANLLKAFSRYAIATDNYKNSKSQTLPYENLAVPSDFPTLMEGMNNNGERGIGYMPLTGSSEAFVTITGRQFILDEGMRVRYTLKTPELNKSNSSVHIDKLHFWHNSKDITNTSVTRTWTTTFNFIVERGYYTYTVDIPVYPSAIGNYIRFSVTEYDALDYTGSLSKMKPFVIDHCEDVIYLAQQLAETSTNARDKALGAELQYYIQAAQTYHNAKKLPEDLQYPDTFSAGWATEDISSYGYKIHMYSYSEGFFYLDPCYVTCLALWDGGELVLYYSVDVRQCDDTFTKEYKALISEEFGVDPNKIFFNATHDHSGPDTTSRTKSNNAKWYKEIFTPSLVSATKNAILDLAPATAYAGKAQSDPGTNYVRRYIRQSGAFTGIHVFEGKTDEEVKALNKSDPVVAYESEADKELRTIRFDRTDKKDILFVNWQGHAAHGASVEKRFTADFVGFLRDGVQKDLDVHFVYCNGASGNLNFTPKLGEQYFTGYYFQGVGKSLVGTVKKAVDAEEPVKTGSFQVTHIEYQAKVKIDPEDLTQKALMVNDACKAYTAANGAWTSVSQQKEYIFTNFNNEGPIIQSTYHLSSVITHNTNASKGTLPIDIFALSFGDIGMGFVPYEQFDTNAKQMRDGVEDLYKICFSAGYTNGTKSYVPSNLAAFNEAAKVNYGGYEVYCCRFEDGTGDNVAATLKDALRAMKGAN